MPNTHPNTGLVDVLGSDHAPHTLEEKQKPWPTSPSGMPGVQTLVPLMLNHVNAGRLVPGYDADFTLVDLKAQRTITNEWSRSKWGWTPFDGMQVTGWPLATIVRGNVVMRDGALQGTVSGQPVQFDV